MKDNPTAELTEAHAARLGAEGFVVLDGWLGQPQAALVRAELLALRARGSFAPARVGQGSVRQEIAEVRSDRICWFSTEARADAVDGRAGVRPGPGVAHLLQRLGGLRLQLNRGSFLSLTDVECHAACYEAGTAYAAHMDVFATDPRRVISFSHYLNADWGDRDGGALRMHTAPTTDIAPLFDRLVLFQSRTMVHEVLPVARRRFSCTGWMRGP